MKKLYYAKKEVDVIFVSDNDSGITLDSQASYFLEEEIKNSCNSNYVKITPVLSEKDVPDHWKGCLIWGIGDDKTATEFLSENDPEYLEYLSLKKKFQ